MSDMTKERFNTIMRLMNRQQEQRREIAKLEAKLARTVVWEYCVSLDKCTEAMAQARCYHILRMLGLPCGTADDRVWSQEYRLAAKWAKVVFEGEQPKESVRDLCDPAYTPKG